ncbi:right-handed parallel beta-helix repeat-containing protein [bacterium]|nr:right-handed parallel beta-helix repeat-containing protein [bacterium]
MKIKKYLTFKTIVILGLCSLLNSSVSALTKPIDFPSKWKLNLGAPSNIEKEVKILDDTGSYIKGSYVFVRGHFRSDLFYVTDGDEFEISFYAKDPEEKDVSCLLYTYSRQESGVLRYSKTIKGFTQKAGKEWTNISGVVKIPKPSEDKNLVDAIIVVMASNTGAYFDYPLIVHIETNKWDNIETARHQGRGKLKFNLGEYSEALQEYNKALKFALTSKDKEQIMANIEETKQAEKFEMTDKNRENIFPKIDLLVKQKKYKEAQAEYEKLKKRSDNSGYLKEIILFNIAELQTLTKDYKNAHKTYEEIYSIPNLTVYYHIYGLFRQAELYIWQKNYNKAIQLYQQIISKEGALEHHILKARLYIGDTYRARRQYRKATDIYTTLLREQETSDFPNEGFRVDLIDRLDLIKELADGKEEKSLREKRVEWVNSPKYAIYVSLEGNDNNSGTKEKPFASIKRAQEEVRKIKSKSMPKGGIAVYLRGGKYFITESISFGIEDSGTEDAPVVYRNYPEEEVRIIGGKQITNFKPLNDPKVLNRLPEESKDKIWVANLKTAGITDYGKLLPRGLSYSYPQSGAMELFFNTKPMNLARWPKEGWEKVADLVTPEGDGNIRLNAYQKGRFKYSGNRPDRWKEEKNIMVAGYFLWEWDKGHYNVKSIDTDERIVNMDEDTRWHKSVLGRFAPVVKDTPYYFYNILSELSVPGEFYIDRDTGNLYFYPPDKIKGSEMIVSTLNSNIVNIKDTSNLLLYGLTLEGTWDNALEMVGGRNNLIAGCTIRNTGVLGVRIKDGWTHGVVGCDIYDTGEGGVKLNGGDVEKLIPGGHYVENNHIYRFNRFSFGGGKFGISMQYGIGNRASHNVVYDSPYIGIAFSENDNIIEYNEVYDTMHEAQDGGALYNHNGKAYLRGRGNVMRYNFIHHIAPHTSPTRSSLVAGITIDGVNGAMTMEGNIFCCNNLGIFSHGPDTRIENNFFINNSTSILMGRRLHLSHTGLHRLLPTVEQLFKEVNYKQPPWDYRYPQAVSIFEDTLPLGKTENNIITRNINDKGFFLNIPLSINAKRSVISNNWEQGDPLFIDSDNMDLALRVGSPVFGMNGIEPIPFERIGLYKDSLRASWPVEKAPAGKYYRPKASLNTLVQQDTDPMTRRFPPLKRISEAREYQVKKRRVPITIDGNLDNSEWLQLDKSKAMLIEENHITGKIKEGARSYAWLLFDDNYLYLGIENCPDPWKEGLKKELPSSLNEITIEGVFGKNTPWWEKDMPIGPLYTFSGHSNGNFKIHDLYGMPLESAELIQKNIEYKTKIIDPKTYHWTAEWKIPFSALSISVKDISSLKFNIGGPKRADWICWVATGGSLWRVDNAGSIKFEK